MSTPGSSRQRGGALLIALLAVALATVIALSLIERGQRAMARTEALLATERAWQYAQGMEALASETLRRAQAGEIDPTVLDGTWTEPFDVPGGHIQGRLLDQQARFNVNALAHPDTAHAATARDAFARLLDRLGLNAAIAEELADWLEGASMPRPGSAADDWYMRLSPPYRTAGGAVLMLITSSGSGSAVTSPDSSSQASSSTLLSQRNSLACASGTPAVR